MTAKGNYPTADASSERPQERETSITAHVVRMVSVTMSFAEMDELCNMLMDGLNGQWLDREAHRRIAREFVGAIDTIR